MQGLIGLRVLHGIIEFGLRNGVLYVFSLRDLGNNSGYYLF
jgi:hypothetical protein